METPGGDGFVAAAPSPAAPAEATEATANGRLATAVAGPESARCTPEQHEKIQVVERLAGSIAHDLNNILTAILGNLQLIQRRDGDNHRIRQMLITAIEASIRGKDMTNRLRAFSQRRHLETRVVDANTLLIGMEKVLRRTVGGRIGIGTRLMEGLWRVETDPAHLEAAILNLAINGREAMPEGGTLTIETANIAFGDLSAWRPSLGARSYVRIFVRDTGCGMTPDLMERIFEPLFTSKPPDRHAGLGLSVVSAFVEKSRGQLTVGSGPGKGTWFEILLPALLDSESVTAVGGASDPGTRSELA